jgi:site-specific DNA recombinase
MFIKPGGVPAIVSEDDFDRVQQLLERRKHHSYESKRNKEKYLLAGKIFCGTCGCAYVGNRKNSVGNRRPNITYRCNNRGRRTVSACKNREVNRDYVESFVLDKIENAIFNKRMVGIVLDQFQEYIRKKNMEKSEMLHRLEKMIQDCEKKQGNLSDILADGVDKLQQNLLLLKLEKIEHDKLELQGRLEQEKAALRINIPDKRELEECFIKARMMFRNKTLIEMKQLINLYVEKVLVYEDEIQVILNLVPSFYRHDFTKKVYTISRDELRHFQGRKKEKIL